MQADGLARQRVGSGVSSDISAGGRVISVALRSVGLDPRHRRALRRLVTPGVLVHDKPSVGLVRCERGLGRALRRPHDIGAVALYVSGARGSPASHGHPDILSRLGRLRKVPRDGQVNCPHTAALCVCLNSGAARAR